MRALQLTLVLFRTITSAVRGKKESQKEIIVTKFFASREVTQRADPCALKEVHPHNLLQLLSSHFSHPPSRYHTKGLSWAPMPHPLHWPSICPFPAWHPPHQITASLSQNCQLLTDSWLAGPCFWWKKLIAQLSSLQISLSVLLWVEICIFHKTITIDNHIKISHPCLGCP